VLSNNSIQPEWRSNYRGDYKGTTNPVCTQDLLCWAYQVARGMDYLASRKVRMTVMTWHLPQGSLELSAGEVFLVSFWNTDFLFHTEYEIQHCFETENVL
jgi:hypothetical protein